MIPVRVDIITEDNHRMNCTGAYVLAAGNNVWEKMCDSQAHLGPAPSFLRRQLRDYYEVG